MIALLGGEQPYRELVRTFDSRNITSDLAAATWLVLAEECLSRVQSAVAAARQRQASVEQESQRLQREASARQNRALAQKGVPVDYERAIPMRGVVDDVAGSLATSSSPLHPDQANQLTQILAHASASYTKGRTAILSPIDWDQALQQASSVLSPPQMASLNQVIAMRYAQDQLRTLVQTAAAPASSNPSPH